MPRRGSSLARRRNPIVIRAIPPLSVMAGSLLPAIVPVIAQSPAVPPTGLLMLLAWRLLRPEIWPLWIGLPLGAFDDLATGHPLGTAMLSWTLALMAIERGSAALMWRDYVQDWLIAGVATIVTLVMGWAVNSFAAGSGIGSPVVLLPQMIASLCLFPLTVRLCAALDRWRLP